MQPDNELHDDPTVIVRTYAADITPGDGRTVDVRIIPYGVRATAVDGLGGLRRGEPYQEEWIPGVFDGQLNAAHRIVGNVEHEKGIAGIVAKGTALHEGSDGFYGSFRFLDTPNGNTALELVRDGTFDSVSLEAHPVRSTRGEGNLVKRVKAHLVGIAFCRWPAFAGASVLAIREGETPVSELMLDEEYLPLAADPVMLARARALGIVLPKGLDALVEESAGTE